MTYHDNRRPQSGAWVAILAACVAVVAFISFEWKPSHILAVVEARLPDFLLESSADRRLEAAKREAKTQLARAATIRDQLDQVNGQIATQTAKMAEFRSASRQLNITDMTVRVGNATWQCADADREIARLYSAILADERLRHELTAHLREVMAGAEDAARRVEELRIQRAQLARQLDGRRRANNDIDKAESFFKNAIRP